MNWKNHKKDDAEVREPQYKDDVKSNILRNKDTKKKKEHNLWIIYLDQNKFEYQKSTAWKCHNLMTSKFVSQVNQGWAET